jgi:DNA-binding MarR family transcriptional regulator
MGERSGPVVTIEDALAHVQALFQAVRRGPPPWAQHDLRFGQLRLLFVLAQAGPVSIGHLAGMLGITDATASEIVDRLVRRGLVIRSHRADDRRVVECRLSDAGASMLADIAGARREALRAPLSVLTASELAQLDGLLLIIAERLSALPPTLASTEGESQVDHGTPPTSPAPYAGRRPA